MRMLLHAIFPNEPFNSLVRSGEAGKILKAIMDDLKPEAVYFTEEDGMRSAILVVDLASPSDVPKVAEPFFLKFDAECRMKIVMSPADLKNAGTRRARQEMGVNRLCSEWPERGMAVPVSAWFRPYHIRAAFLNSGAVAWPMEAHKCLPGT